MKPREWSWFNRIFFAVFVVVLIGVIVFLAWRQSVAAEERTQLINALTQSQEQLRDEGIEPVAPEPEQIVQGIVGPPGKSGEPGPKGERGEKGKRALRELPAHRGSLGVLVSPGRRGHAASRVLLALRGNPGHPARRVPLALMVAASSRSCATTPQAVGRSHTRTLRPLMRARAEHPFSKENSHDY